MKISNPRLFLLVFLVTKISAFSDAGAYERLWYWYAYTLDTGDGNKKIAPGCAKNGRRCTFEQFMTFIDDDKPPYKKIKPEKLRNINPNNVKEAVSVHRRQF